MTNNDELALKLKAAADKLKREQQHSAFAVAEGFEFIGIATPENILSLLAERDADKKRIAELEAVCAESYQVVGALADAAGVFETSDAVSKALDNLSEAKLVHGDVLPFAVEARTVSVKLPENIPCHGAPQTIWLQTNGDDSNESSWPENSNDVSWCWEKIFHNDTLYVRADLAAGINLEVGE